LRFGCNAILCPGLAAAPATDSEFENVLFCMSEPLMVV
jgi:hypothetical protein